MASLEPNRRELLRMGAAAAAAAAAGPARAQDPRPNIVLILTDDLDFDEIAPYDPARYPCYGGAHSAGIPTRPRAWYQDPRMLTPNIESIARTGLTFSRFYVTSAVCTPSRYSFLTGRYASRSVPFCERFPPGTPGTIQWNTNLDPGESNIARELKRAGYATGVVGKWHLGVGRPNGRVQGLAEDADPFDPQVNRRIRETYERNLRYIQENFGWDYAERIYVNNKEWLGLPRRMAVHNLEWITEGALEFIGRYHRRPFFLYMPLTLPHGKYGAKMMRGDPRFTPAGVLEKPPEVMPPRESVFERVRKAGIEERNAVATWIDDAVGAVMRRLEELGVADNTLFIFTSDHGSRGKYTCYEACRVPFLVRWPRVIGSAREVDTICANIDLAPTFLELAGAAPPEDMARDGASFVPVLKGGPEPSNWRDGLYLECSNIRGVVGRKWKYIANRPPAEAQRAIQADALEAARTGRLRLVSLDGQRNPHRGAAREGVRYGVMYDFPNYFHHDQLYDLDNDVFEQRNLACDPSFRGVLDEMKDRLRRLMRSLPHTFGEFKTS